MGEEMLTYYQLRQTYGQHIVDEVKNIENLLRKLANQKNRRIF